MKRIADNRVKLNATAYHEAGHAVVACLADIPFRHVTIKPTKVFAGHVQLSGRRPSYANPWDPDTWQARAARQYWTRYVFALLAGALAETLYTKCWQQQAESDENTDECKAWQIADYFDPPAKAGRWVNKVRFQVLEALRRPEIWAAVDAVARVLVERRELNRAEVQALVRAVVREDRVRVLGHRSRTPRSSCALIT